MNLRPSGYEPDELPGCSIPRQNEKASANSWKFLSHESYWFFSRFGGDLLSHVLRRSTIGATALNDRVRDGIGCFARAMTTKPRKKPSALHLGFSWLEAAFRRSRQRVPTPRVIQVQRLPPDIQVGLHIGVQAKFVYALICV